MTATFTIAGPADRAMLTRMVEDFHIEEHIPHARACDDALATLLAAPAIGQAVIIHEAPAAPAGYFILTYSFSLERGGKTALLDELYILPASRKKGLAKAALAHAKTLAKAAGCTTLLLEVDHNNQLAHSLYTKAGFTALPRHYLTVPL